MNNRSISIEALLYEEDSIQDQIDNIVLELIKVRKKNKMTQTELSRSTGIPQATISRIESLYSVPTLKILLKISNALGLSLSLKQVGEPQ